MTRKNTEEAAAETRKKQKQRHGNRQKNLPRNDTEKHGRSRSRDTETAEELATNGHGSSSRIIRSEPEA